MEEILDVAEFHTEAQIYGLEHPAVRSYFMNRLTSFDENLRTSIDTYCNHLMAKVDKRPPYLFRPNNIRSLRKDLVSWLIDTSNKLEFNVRIKHLGVYLMHIYLNHHTDIAQEKWEMVASCCLLLAAKVDESPMHKKLSEILRNKYELCDWVRQEMDILKFFKFNVMHVTIVDFMEICSIFAVHPTDRRYGQIKDFEAITPYVNKYISYFLDKVLNASYHRLRPDRVAAAIILTTRHLVQLTPPWPVVLQHVTGYTERELNTCSKLLRGSLNKDTIRGIIRCAIDPINSACCNAVCSPLNSPLKKPAILSFTKYPLMKYTPPCRKAASSPLSSPLKKPAILSFTKYPLMKYIPPCRKAASSPLSSLASTKDAETSPSSAKKK